MRAVTIYTRPFCGFCSSALALLRSKGAQINEIEAGFDSGLRAEMEKRSGRRTFPQIFIGEVHVGGCDELYALDAGGGLEPLLETV